MAECLPNHEWMSGRIAKLEKPTGIPLVYELDDDLAPIRHYYLGDPEAAKKAAEAVARQAQKRAE